jgi:hypothetical protein
MRLQGAEPSVCLRLLLGAPHTLMETQQHHASTSQVPNPKSPTTQNKSDMSRCLTWHLSTRERNLLTHLCAGRIHDGGARVVHKVGAHQLVLLITKDALRVCGGGDRDHVAHAACVLDMQEGTARLLCRLLGLPTASPTSQQAGELPWSFWKVKACWGYVH